MDNPVALLIKRLIPVAAVVLTDVPGLITTLPVLKAVQVGVLVPQLIIIHPVGKLLVVALLLQRLQGLNVVDGIVLIVGAALTANGVQFVVIMVLAELVELSLGVLAKLNVVVELKVRIAVGQRLQGLQPLRRLYPQQQGVLLANGTLVFARVVLITASGLKEESLAPLATSILVQEI